MVDRQYRCPVCGAPVEGEKCEYCGCVIYDFANISTEEPRYIRMKINNPYDRHGTYILQMKAIAVNPSMEIKYDDYVAQGRGCDKFTVRRSATCKMSVDFVAVEDDGNFYTIQILEE